MIDVSYTDDKQSWQGVILKSWKAWSSGGLYVHEGILFANVYDLSMPLLLQHLIVYSSMKIRRHDLISIFALMLFSCFVNFLVMTL